VKALCVLLGMVVAAFGGGAATVTLEIGERLVVLHPEVGVWPWEEEMLTAGQNGAAYSYRGISLSVVLEAMGGLGGRAVHVIAADGRRCTVPSEVALGQSALGEPVIAFLRDGAEWPGGPALVFFPEDGHVSVEQVRETLSLDTDDCEAAALADGILVSDVAWVLDEWDGSTMSLPETLDTVPWAEIAKVEVVAPKLHRFTLRDLVTSHEVVVGRGTYVPAIGAEVERKWAGVPLTVLLGNWPDDAQVEAVAEDGYRMLYSYGELEDEDSRWILAFMEDGEYMPFDPGHFRLVRIGSEIPRFEAARSGKMIVRVKVEGVYEPYRLHLEGHVERELSREVLEAGVGCPCKTYSVQGEGPGGESYSYTGLPLWRLVAYVDDERYPPEERGIHYDDEHFNDRLAQTGYTVVIEGREGHRAEVPSELLARDDRYLLALKREGRFLSTEDGGPVTFVWDAQAESTKDMERVPWVKRIAIKQD